MTVFVVKDGMCWVEESQQRDHQGKSFQPAKARIEPPPPTPWLHNGMLKR